MNRFFALPEVALIAIVLQAGMSRTAWVAALGSSAGVYWMQEIGTHKTRRWVCGHKKAAYAKRQAAYFASGKASETEAMVAGAPEYAFNEYLQIGVERGAAGLLSFLAFLGFSFFSAIRSRQFGAAGGLLALCIFSTASYPLQLPEFAVALLFLSATTVTGRKKKTTISSFYLLIPCVFLSTISFQTQQDQKQHYHEWSKARQLHNLKASESALPHYETLYPFLKHKLEFLFEMGQCQSKTGDYAHAIATLKRASRLSADPMIHYMIAKNEQATGNAVLTKEPKVQSSAIREMRKEVEKITIERLSP